MQKNSLKRSNWKTKYETIDSSSKFHEKIRSIFCNDPFFKNLSCYQEVPVAALVPDYNKKNHHVDWYIDELGIVLELHGEQHYKLVNFGNKAFHEAVKDFNNIKYRDNMKKYSLIDNGYEYREISYKQQNKIDGKKLKKILLEGVAK